MSYQVNIDKFYGPLDLLLYLIEKEEMDIYDIPVALIADQYTDYLHTSGQIDLDNIGEFLIMASYLLNLKSRMLIPGLTETEDDYDRMDPREELVNKILEYKKYKQAAEFFALRYNGDINRVFFRDGLDEIEGADRVVESSLGSLLRAWLAVLERDTAKDKYEVPQRDINIGEKIDIILGALPDHGAMVRFQDICPGAAIRREVLAYFLALLELVRLQKVSAYQENQFGDILLCLRVALDNVNAG